MQIEYLDVLRNDALTHHGLNAAGHGRDKGLGIRREGHVDILERQARYFTLGQARDVGSGRVAVSGLDIAKRRGTKAGRAVVDRQRLARLHVIGLAVLVAEVEGVDCDYWNFKDIDSVFDYYTPVMIANNDFLKNSPDEAKAFLAATKKGYQYAIDNPKKAADLLIAGDDTGSLKGSEDLVYKSQEWLSKQYVADADNWGVIDETRWNNFYKWLAENKLTTKDLTGKGFSNDYLPK